MKTLSTTQSMQTFRNELIYTEAALSASTETTYLASQYKEHLEQWFDHSKQERFVREEVIRAGAMVKVRDQSLDSVVSEFSIALLLSVNRNRQDHLYKRFFPISPSKVVRYPLAKQIEMVKNKFLPTIEELEESHILKPYMEKLENAVNNAESALDRYSSAKYNRQLVTIDMAQWKDKMNALRTDTLAELMKISTKTARSKSWVQSFFYRSKRKKEIEEEMVITTVESPSAISEPETRIPQATPQTIAA